MLPNRRCDPVSSCVTQFRFDHGMAWKLKTKDHKSGSIAEHTINQPVALIGRDSNSDVIFKHDRVSRRHVELRKTEDGVLSLVDFSSNGTFIREAKQWKRIDGTRTFDPPVMLRISHWTVQVDENGLDEEPEQQGQRAWDDSVMIPAASLRQRTEAILVFDLCESSLIASTNDHMAYHLKQRLTQIADPILQEFERRFFKSTGDGFLATFGSSEKALDAAKKIEMRIRQRNSRTSNIPIHYRIALHYGDVWAISAGGDDVHGNDINITFRIEGVQSPAFDDCPAALPERDRILCSGRFLDQLDDVIKSDGTQYIDCGAARLKGIVERVKVYWLQRDNIEAEVAADTVQQSAQEYS